tara:strand:+ start:51 stop:563 length:513 start_codon:yes stop_codon:yes gene_type:complete
MTLEDRFKVFDSFLPQDEYNNLVDIIRDDVKIKWTWQCSKTDNQVFMASHVQDDPFYHTHILSYIKDCFNSEVKPLRIYYNAQLPNCHGSYHEDDGDVTAILYINQFPYEPEWGGWTELYDKNTGEHHMITPTDNNLLLFDANLTHRGLAFLNYSDPIRINLTYKLRITS